MPPTLLDPFLHWLGGTPCFRVYGKSRRERDWRIVAVYANHRRDWDGRWPLLAGCCTTWAADVIAIGWDFALGLLREQAAVPASRSNPVAVAGGRLGDSQRRAAADVSCGPGCSEVMAHECGHTWQAIRMGAIYLPLVGSVTLFGEGPHPRNRFENEASEQGLFGGLVNGSVCAPLMRQLTSLP
ncbi:MAG TPA: hypothetical protein VE988_10630 [Gemmataceae bacterium]|nr:hypothetical protein [Gemmataceae bacterium]